MKFNLLKGITRIGTRHVRNADDEEDIILSNKVSMLMSILPLIYVVANVYDQGWSRITLPILAQPLLFLLPVLVNAVGYTTFSRVLLSWNMPLQALIFSIYNKSSGMDFQTSHYMGIQYSIMASAVVPFLLFRLKDTFLLAFSLAGPLLALMCFDLVHNFFGVGYHQKGLTETGYALTKMRVLIGFIIIAGSSLFLKRSVAKKEQVNKGLIADLEGKNHEILGQLEEISTQNEYISMQNSQLEQQKETIENQNRLLQLAKLDLEKKVREKTADIVQASQELEKQYLQLEQFAFMAAHNLRGPVARILGLLQLLQFPEIDLLEKEKVMTLIGGSILDLDEVIHDLVSVVQVKYQSADNNRKLRASDIIRKVLSQLQQDLDAQGIVISNEINPRHEIAVNDAFAHSILHNIISNSIKYKDASKTPHILLRSEVNETECILEISDNGIGFDADAHRDKLFKPFSRLNTHFSGKGLGLYLAKVQVESAGGRIFASSKINEGTTIKLQFPIGAGLGKPN
jgi:signal transduction histidine kinase